MCTEPEDYLKLCSIEGFGVASMENAVLTSWTGMGACSVLILKVLKMLIQTHSDFRSMN